jgi:hypothetical protein
MRFMIIVKASEESERGELPSREMLAAMGNYNERLVEAGIMLAGEGLKPSANGSRVRFTSGRTVVTDGPFPETKELIAGFWLWQVQSKEEALEWVRQCPMEEGAEIEIRPLFEADDFGEEFTPELREQEERLRERVAQRRS